MRIIHTIWFTSVDFETPEGEFFLKSTHFIHDGYEKIASYNYICPIRNLDEINIIQERMCQEPQFQRWFFEVEGREGAFNENVEFVKHVLHERNNLANVSGVAAR